MNQQTRDSMRFLYTKETTTYDTLLVAIKAAEIEWLESKNQIRMKSAIVVNREDEIDELRKKLDRLVATMKSNNFKGTKKRSREGILHQDQKPTLQGRRKTREEI